MRAAYADPSLLQLMRAAAGVIGREICVLTPGDLQNKVRAA